MARGNIEALITRGDQLVKSLAEPIITEAKKSGRSTIKRRN